MFGLFVAVLNTHFKNTTLSKRVGPKISLISSDRDAELPSISTDCHYRGKLKKWAR